jgi:hypothetical protein
MPCEGFLTPSIHRDQAEGASSPRFEQASGRSERDGAVGSQLPMAAVVQQDVAALVPAPVAANAALYPRRERLRVGCIPIVGGYVPHYRGQAEFRRSP